MIELIQDRIVDSRKAATPVSLDEPRMSQASNANEPGGLAGWVLELIRGRKAKAAEKRLHVVETLALGGRRQLLLVSCDGERFLVGSGADRVDTIVRVGPAKPSEEPWV